MFKWILPLIYLTRLSGYLGLSPVLSRLLAACNGTEYFICSWFAVYTIGSPKLQILYPHLVFFFRFYTDQVL